MTDFVFMHAKTLTDLCRKGKAERHRHKDWPRYALYGRKRVITCEELEPGEIVDEIPSEAKQRLRNRFDHLGWPIPEVLQQA